MGAGEHGFRFFFEPSGVGKVNEQRQGFIVHAVFREVNMQTRSVEGECGGAGGVGVEKLAQCYFP